MRVPSALALAAALACAAGARAAEISAVPDAALSAPLAPALLSPDGPAGAPLETTLAEAAERISLAPSPEPILLQMAAAAEPVERAAAGILARAVTDPRAAAVLLARMPGLATGPLPTLAARRPALGAAAPLAQAARRDPTLGFLFDGSAPGAVAPPQSAELDGDDLLWQGRRLAPLGRGAFGVVHAHPEVDGAVVKIDSPRQGDDGGIGAARARLAFDAKSIHDAESAGLGPRLLGAGLVDGRPALVKERVYGETVTRLLEGGAFGPEEHSLLEALALRAARGAGRFVDVGPDNVMIGRTLADPARRAFLTDGGVVLPGRSESVAEAAEGFLNALRARLAPDLLERFDRVHFAQPAIGDLEADGRETILLGGRAFTLTLRRGSDQFGRHTMLIDAVDSAAPEAGTVAHIDLAFRGEQASLDNPLDSSHWSEGLWFGLAVLPPYQRTGLGARLLDEAVALLRRAGVRRLFITATDTSRPFYLKRFGTAVQVDEAERGREGDVLHRLEVGL